MTCCIVVNNFNLQILEFKMEERDHENTNIYSPNTNIIEVAVNQSVQC